MNKSIHHLIIIGIILSVTLSFSTAMAAGTGYPNKPISVVVPMAARGSIDTLTRAITKAMEKYVGQTFLVDCRPGAAGLIAGDYVAKAKPDGYTLGSFVSPACDPDLWSFFRPDPPFATKDLKPVVRVLVYPYCLASKKDAPWKNLQEFVKYVRDNPNKVRWGHPGAGQQMHIFGVLFAMKHNLQMIPVPFKGGAENIVALLGGHIEASVISVSTLKVHFDAGKVIMLGIENPVRPKYMPQVPLFKELGFDLGLAPFYGGLYAPKNTPDEVTKKIHDAAKRALETPELIKFAFDNGADLYYGSAEDLSNDMKRDQEIIGPLIKKIKDEKLPY